jgi:hypothetical protein
MRSLLFCLAGLILLLVCSAGIWAQSSSSSPAGGASSPSAPANAQTPDASSSPSSSSASPSSFPASKPAKAQAPDLSPPRSDRVNVGDLGTELGESSSRDTQPRHGTGDDHRGDSRVGCGNRVGVATVGNGTRVRLGTGAGARTESAGQCVPAGPGQQRCGAREGVGPR